jgi:hemerythrin superfamily protein
MDATELLRRDHETMDRLFRQLAESRPTDLAARRVLFRMLKSELEAHSRIEEEVFYPAVMRLRSAPARESVRNALEEHQAIDGLLAEIDQMETDDPQFAARLLALRQAVERHVVTEEGALFSEARIHLTDERLEALGRQMETRRRELASSAVADELAAMGSPISGGPGAAAPGRKAPPNR